MGSYTKHESSDLEGKVMSVNTTNMSWYNQDGIRSFHFPLLDYGEVRRLQVRFLGDFAALYPIAGLTFINGSYYVFDFFEDEERLFKVRITE